MAPQIQYHHALGDKSTLGPGAAGIVAHHAGVILKLHDLRHSSLQYYRLASKK